MDCYNYLTSKWDVTKLPTMYISHHKNFDYNYKILENSYNIRILDININKLHKNKNNKYIKEFGNNIVNKLIDVYYDIVIEMFENTKFEQKNQQGQQVAIVELTKPIYQLVLERVFFLY